MEPQDLSQSVSPLFSYDPLTNNSIYTLYFQFPTKGNTYFSLLNTAQQMAARHYTAATKEKKKSCSHSLDPHHRDHCPEQHAGLKQWGNSVGDSVNGDSDRLRFFFLFFYFCPF